MEDLVRLALRVGRLGRAHDEPDRARHDRVRLAEPVDVPVAVLRIARGQGPVDLVESPAEPPAPPEQPVDGPVQPGVRVAGGQPEQVGGQGRPVLLGQGVLRILAEGEDSARIRETSGSSRSRPANTAGGTSCRAASRMISVRTDGSSRWARSRIGASTSPSRSRATAARPWRAARPSSNRGAVPGPRRGRGGPRPLGRPFSAGGPAQFRGLRLQQQRGELLGPHRFAGRSANASSSV